MTSLQPPNVRKAKAPRGASNIPLNEYGIPIPPSNSSSYMLGLNEHAVLGNSTTGYMYNEREDRRQARLKRNAALANYQKLRAAAIAAATSGAAASSGVAPTARQLFGGTRKSRKSRKSKKTRRTTTR